MADRSKRVTCLTLNLLLPGLGSLLVRKYAAGIMQSLISMVAATLLIGATIDLYAYLQELTKMEHLENVPMSPLEKPLILMVSGIVLFKISWIWAQVTTAGHMKATRHPPILKRTKGASPTDA
ncbi:MAG: hypothetical protein HOD72_02485 [Opitutae bacterium]|jgi:hypothetical protein|nr:hypothetical protein [Opitutae bacterium]MBT5380935.1 hypothetical protein [Opitutae bacterium]MBT5692172.1 hypothetical protein [Opitutae bacterium]MBT6462653.1 hypothetical protein [Opitutae bacterium]